VLKEYCEDVREARRHCRAYTHACLIEDDGPIIEAMGVSRCAIGDAGFVELAEQRIEGRRTGRVQDEDLALPHCTVPIVNIDAAVARYYGIAVERLQAHGQSAGVANVAAVELACRLTGLTQRAIGLHYGGITSAAVSTIRRKVREGDYETRPPIEAILPRLTGKRRRQT
jgi:hypothetical protein